MRIVEIKQKLDKVMGDDNQIVIQSEISYDGSGQWVSNYSDILDILEFFIKSDLINIDKESFNDLVQAYPKESNKPLQNDIFNELNDMLNHLNMTLPLYYSFIKTVAPTQEEQVINIKLPNNIKNFEDLNKVNERLNNVFKLYNLDGQFDFRGFDKGTDWYSLITAGSLSYLAFVGALNIASKYFEMRKNYYDSKTAKFKSKIAEIEYRAATGKDKSKINESDVEEYVKRKFNLQRDEDVKELMKHIDKSKQ